MATIIGTAGNDTLVGTSGNDSIVGLEGNDSLVATGGRDTLVGGAGADTLDGSTTLSAATADYGQSGAAVFINMSDALPESGGDAEGDVLLQIDDVIGTAFNDSIVGISGGTSVGGPNSLTGGDGDDTLVGGIGGASPSGADTFVGGAGADLMIGDVGSDLMFGGTGDDVIDGGAGNDSIFGGTGADLLTGGAGNDLLSYEGATSGVAVNLGDGLPESGGYAQGDTVSGFESLVGGNFRDTLIGDEGDNYIAAGWTGGLGQSGDLLIGGGGNDTLVGAWGAKLVGGAGADVLDGGIFDFGTADYSTSPTGVNVNLGDGAPESGGDAQGDTLTRVAYLVGSDFGDTLIGTAGINSLTGGQGADYLDGAGSDDTLFGGAGADTLIGGSGTDTADYSGADSAVSFVIGGSSIFGSGGEANGDVLTQIERIIGTSFGDTLTATGPSATLYGGAGNDLLSGGGTLVGGAGADTLQNAIAVDYSGSSAGVQVNLSDGLAETGGDAEGDIVTGITRLAGSSFNDLLIGTAGVDTLDGGDGNDTLAGLASGDTLIGGSGADTADYSASNAAVNVNLSDLTAESGGHAAGDVLSGIENVTGSAFNDTLIGDTAANALDGGAGIDTAFYNTSSSGVNVTLGIGTNTGGSAEGDTLTGVENLVGSAFNDTLTGDAGNNVLTGNGGADLLVGGDGIDTADYSTSNNGVGIALDGTVGSGGHAQGDSLVGIENITGSAFNDTLTGDAGANRLLGGFDNDVLVGGAGADFLEGSQGSDTADYSTSTAGVNISLRLGTASGGDATGDTLTFIENVIGSAHGDTLTGDSNINVLNGGSGNDLLTAFGFGDTLYGGAGNDTLRPSSGNLLSGGDGIDTADYSQVTSALAITLSNFGDIENLTGTSFNDRLTGNQGDNLLTGGGGNDTLRSDEVTGSQGNDTLDGGNGNDSLTGSWGNDTLIGGAGSDTLVGDLGDDTADYSGSALAVNVNLADGLIETGGDAEGDTLSGIENLTGSAQNDTLTGDGFANVLEGGGGADLLTGGGDTDTADYSGSALAVNVNLGDGLAEAGGDAEGDALSGIENLTGSSQNDTLTGDAQANLLDGAGGDDSISGAGGDDTLIGGQGADALTGGDGIDTADYSSSTVAVDVSLDGTMGVGGDAEGDTLGGVENLIGGAFNDTLTGDDAANLFFVGEGNNLVSGAGGDDTLIGGIGADTFVGGAGIDWVEYGGFDVVQAESDAVNIDLSDGVAESGGEAEGDSLSGVEGVIGSSRNDTIIGDVADNIFIGLSGDDLLSGGGGNDSIEGGSWSDTLVGGEGADTLFGGDDFDLTDYSASSAGISISMDGLTPGVGGDAEGDILSAIETVIGSAFNDTIIGSASADSLVGGDGNDRLSGAGSDDTLAGGEGNDTLIGGTGADELRGGSGTDTADYSTDTQGVTVNLATGTATGGDALGDTLSSIENLTGGTVADVLTGDDLGNVLTGGGGNDTLIGGAGADTLVGGAGSDTTDYSASSAGISVAVDGLTPGVGDDAEGDVLSGMEVVIGSVFNDTITGSSSTDTLLGGDGNDRLSGGASGDSLVGGEGNDTLIGGTGGDRLNGGNGIDTADYSTSSQGVAVSLQTGSASGGDAAFDQLISIENLTGSSANDTLTGNDLDNVLAGGGGNDSLTGGAGNDTLVGGTGADLLQGNGGIDTADYSGSTGSVSVSLATNRGTLGDALNDRLISVENVTGGLGDDTLTGGIGGNVLAGGEGADSLDGGASRDTLDGGAGNDTLVGGDGADLVFGGAGNDTILVGDGDSINGNDDSDTFIVSGPVTATIDGGAGGADNDVLDLSAASNYTVNYSDTTPGALAGTVVFRDSANPDSIIGTLTFTEIEGVICFTPGTLIETVRGPVPVEELRQGDRVLTRDNGWQEIAWIGRRDLTARQLRKDESLRPIVIRAGSLGDNLPESDLLVSPAHRMLVGSRRAQLYFEEPEVLVAAKHLAGVPGIAQSAARPVSYIHFMCSRHEVVRANGAWAESFLPGDHALTQVGEEQRAELFRLFPELALHRHTAFPAARRILKRHEALVLNRDGLSGC
ncbi:Hint domain-containing protein [Tabrizicola sp.]|uniref:Hint domain-containing protein n=1 Tax=Tabrizicola sp. TaxID=2005166 RepID=UPI003F3B2D8C